MRKERKRNKVKRKKEKKFVLTQSIGRSMYFDPDVRTPLLISSEVF